MTYQNFQRQEDDAPLKNALGVDSITEGIALGSKPISRSSWLSGPKGLLIGLGLGLLV